MQLWIPPPTVLSTRKCGQYVSGGVFSVPPGDRDVHDSPKAQKLTQEQQSALASRLCSLPQPHRLSFASRKLQPLPGAKSPGVQGLTRDKQEASVQRLYKVSVERKKALLVQLEKKTHPSMVEIGAQKYHPDQINQSVNRLYDDSLEGGVKRREKLREKHLAPLVGGKMLSADELKASMDRLYRGALDQQVQTRNKLQEKYLSPIQKPPRVLSDS